MKRASTSPSSQLAKRPTPVYIDLTLDDQPQPLQPLVDFFRLLDNDTMSVIFDNLYWWEQRTLAKTCKKNYIHYIQYQDIPQMYIGWLGISWIESYHREVQRQIKWLPNPDGSVLVVGFHSTPIDYKRKAYLTSHDWPCAWPYDLLKDKNDGDQLTFVVKRKDPIVGLRQSHITITIDQSHFGKDSFKHKFNDLSLRPKFGTYYSTKPSWSILYDTVKSAPILDDKVDYELRAELELDPRP